MDMIFLFMYIVSPFIDKWFNPIMDVDYPFMDSVLPFMDIFAFTCLWIFIPHSCMLYLPFMDK